MMLSACLLRRLNEDGQLGVNSIVYAVSTPTQVAGGYKWRQLAAGAYFTCGLELNSSLAFCWGSNYINQLGSTRNADQLERARVPLPVAGGIAFASISSGSSHTCGMSQPNGTHNSTAYCWGDNSSQQLGRADTDSPVGPVPVPVSGDWNVSQVVASADSSFGFLRSANDSGQADVEPVVVPVPPPPVEESSTVPIGAVVGGVVGGLGERRLWSCLPLFL